MFATLAACGIGALLGMRHAFEPDHLAAVSTLAAEQRGRKAGFILGAFWGAGHALSLVVVAGTLVVLGAQMPEQLATAFEALVGVVIVALGVRAVRKAIALGRSGAVTPHSHGPTGEAHVHAGPAGHIHVSRLTLATRPLMMGVLHGLAGSGALTALVVARMEGTPARLMYVAVFALGSVLGMSVLTGTATVWMERPAARRWDARLLGAAGTIAVIVGTYWGITAVSALWPFSVSG